MANAQSRIALFAKLTRDAASMQQLEGLRYQNTSEIKLKTCNYYLEVIIVISIQKQPHLPYFSCSAQQKQEIHQELR